MSPLKLVLFDRTLSRTIIGSKRKPADLNDLSGEVPNLLELDFTDLGDLIGWKEVPLWFKVSQVD